MMSATLIDRGERLWAYSIFAAVLSAAGLPIYIFAPKFFADSYGVSLTTLAAILFGLRILDIVQDPVFGWISERLGTYRRVAIAGGGVAMAGAMVAMFAVIPPLSPAIWFAITLTVLFSAFSFLTINFYAQGIVKAEDIGGQHTRLAGWRETGAFLGICLAAMAPTLLTGATASPFAAFSWGFAAIAMLAVMLMTSEWQNAPLQQPTPVRTILSDFRARRLLLIGLVNATPLAVSSTLFLFFVEARLDAPGAEGPLLVLFFLAAAVSAPLWAMSANRHGAKPVLLSAMVLAIMSFGCAAFLGAGDVWIFAIICVLSGATIGADMTLLPAIFARRMARISPTGAQGFGLWAFVSKFTLAFAAVLLLPLLEASGFQSGSSENSATALNTLSVLYAIVPCALKLLAIVLLTATKLEE